MIHAQRVRSRDFALYDCYTHISYSGHNTQTSQSSSFPSPRLIQNFFASSFNRIHLVGELFRQHIIPLSEDVRYVIVLKSHRGQRQVDTAYSQ